MTILVTGGTGFIGAEVVRLLLEKGGTAFVFHRRAARQRLADVADNVTFIQGDLGNFSHVLEAVKRAKPTAIYHLGAMLSVPSDANPATSLQTNVMGTYHVLEAARLFEVPQVIFSSSIAAYGTDIEDDVIDDNTLQRPQLFYGATKVFGEHMGLFYKRKYGLDFRGIRYPSIVGPGVKTPGIAQYTSWVIEETAKGNPFTIMVAPETRIPVTYFKDAAQAIIKLAETPVDYIKTINYLIDGLKPTPSAGELVEIVKTKIPTAQINFDPNMTLQTLLDNILRPLDDSRAKQEWGWEPYYDQEHIIDDFLEELKLHPERYI